MFFPERIKSVKRDDHVLEIGPGGAPHPRADVLLEKIFENEEMGKAQRGFAPKLKTNKKTIYYDGKIFPFRDKEFDYVICSHVLEHILDVEGFIKEMFRVARRGYLEYPMIYYDYVYNFPEHVTFLKFNYGKLFYLPKYQTALSEFSEVNKLFYESLKAEHFGLIDALQQVLFEDFEWSEPFEVEKAKKISDVCWTNVIMPLSANARGSVLNKIKNTGKRLLKCLK